MSSFQKLEITEVKKTLLEISGGILDQIAHKVQETKKIDPNYSDLDLSDIKIGKFFIDINTMLNKHTHLQLLYLVDCSLSSIQGFSIPSLMGIDLSKNHIGDNSHLQSLLNCKKLQQIIIVDNKIQKLDTLLKLTSLKNLYEIDFSKNPVFNTESTNAVFQKFENIVYVNGKDINGVQVPLQNEQEYQSQNSYEEDYQDFEQDLNENDNQSDNEDGEEKQKKKKKKR